MHYQNLLFDLYGTLADIHTNESPKKLWNLLAVWYKSHGAFYSPWELQKTYQRFVQEEKSRQLYAIQPIAAWISGWNWFLKNYIQRKASRPPRNLLQKLHYFSVLCQERV